MQLAHRKRLRDRHDVLRALPVARVSSVSEVPIANDPAGTTTDSGAILALPKCVLRLQRALLRGC